jgi:hypothetical protein
MPNSRFRFFALTLAAALVAALATSTSAFPWASRPALVVSAGGTFAVTGTPDGGGLSFSISPMWPVTERVRFGLVAYADDMGSTLVELRDPNDGTSLGTAADLHRWAWGAAWRADADVWSLGRWAGGASGAWGYWRVEDDRRGQNLAAASALGFTLGADARHPVGRARDIGLALRYHRLSLDRSAGWRRVDRYASAALELRWAAAGRND